MAPSECSKNQNSYENRKLHANMSIFTRECLIYQRHNHHTSKKRKFIIEGNNSKWEENECNNSIENEGNISNESWNVKMDIFNSRYEENVSTIIVIKCPQQQTDC